MFEAVSNKVSFPDLEKEILGFWEENDTFVKSVEMRKDSEEYVFYDGPPFATGLPHYGHLLAGTIKDIVPRYQAMRGHYVKRRFGWDCHGLPIEALAQEKLGLAGTAAIMETGIDVFNETCRSMVQTYVDEWRTTVTRMGRWVDFDHDYKTMDTSFMETIWWVFRQLWDQGRVYKSYRIMPYSWKLTTPLSNFEANSNYKDVQDPSITVRVKVKTGDDALLCQGDVYLLVWTTTPWTLPENLGICAGPDVDYCCIRDVSDGSLYVMADARIAAYYKSDEEYEVIQRMKGVDLAGWTYEPLFPYFADEANAFQVLNDGFVSTDDGTGLVHMAPAYGEEDFRICKEAGIGLVDPLDENCAFTAQVPEYAGQFCKDADKAIIRRLKDEGKLVHQSTIVHSYPFCERTDTPLIYRAIDAWYVRVEDIRDDLVTNNDSIHWVPDYVGDKRFGNWLKDAKDWNISRNRFWGSCIPIWVNVDDPDDMICVGSIDELHELSGQKLDDLHKHIVDKVLIEKDGKTYRRTPEVLDCWFESGSMPYAQNHYPFENKVEFESHFPADFIAEGLDQTRGWFYTLLVLSTMLFGKSCYRNVVVNGLILADDGRKMSKRLKNYPDPNYVMDTYGADALRLYMINSPVVRAEDLCFSEEGVKHALRHFLIPLWNAYSFFVTYAKIDGWDPSACTGKVGGNLLDKWIMSSLDHLNQDVVEAMDQYDLQRSVRPFVTLIEDLTNWYIRRSRRRFWKSSDDSDKAEAYETLYTVLLRLSKIAAPYVPFISEAIYRNLRTEDMPLSVHLCDFPVTDGAHRDEELEAQMSQVMTVVSLGRKIRSEHDLKVRQPLKGIHVVSRDAAALNAVGELKHIIAEELNVKNVWFSDQETDLVTLKAKPNFKTLGPRLGPAVKKSFGPIQQLGQEDLVKALEGGTITIEVDGTPCELTGNDLAVERLPKDHLAVSSEGSLVVAVETEISPELRAEGIAREVVNKIQNMRKDADYEVVQRIRVVLSGDPEAQAAVQGSMEYVKNETLCEQFDFVDVASEGASHWDINGLNCWIGVEQV